MWAWNALPSWVVTRITLATVIKRTQPDHPWIDRKFDLADWAAGRTGATKMFDFVMWEAAICIPIALWKILHHA